MNQSFMSFGTSVQRYVISVYYDLQIWFIGTISATFLKKSVNYSIFVENLTSCRIIFCKNVVV